MPKNSWTKSQVQYLIENYSNTPNKELIKIFKKKNSTIKEYARKRGLRKSYSKSKANRKGTLERLLEETPEAYYWIGFIFADGYFSNDGRLVVTSSWDKKHIKKLSLFLSSSFLTLKKSKSKYNFKGSRDIFYSTGVKDKDHFYDIKKKFNFKQKKTYNPPNINFLNIDWKFLSFLIGFIDGDGSVNKYNAIRIANHKNWISVHESFKLFLKDIEIESKVSVSKIGESHIYISSHFYSKALKFIKEYSIPCLLRKWNNKPKIENKNYYTLKNNFDFISDTISGGSTHKEIAKYLKVSKEAVSGFCSRYKIKKIK